ncbi:basic proline-rich protein-like [Sus scrofa]|uniref:basic proline-rich protein-like n=1 Tax=Sus scrofa TaxID=9823 RepID=UPI000A2B1CA5|nr:basic proline-rich protein-like [Sus scrofa]
MGARERLLTAHWGVSVPGQPRGQWNLEPGEPGTYRSSPGEDGGGMDWLCCIPLSRGRGRGHRRRHGRDGLCQACRTWMRTRGGRLGAVARRDPESPPPETRQEQGEEGRRPPEGPPHRLLPGVLCRAGGEHRSASCGHEDTVHMSLTTLEGLAPPEAQPEAGDLEPEAKMPAERKDPGAAPRRGPRPQEDSAPGQGGPPALSEGHSCPRGDSPHGEDEPSAPLPRGPAPLEEPPPGKGGTKEPPAGGPGPHEDSTHGVREARRGLPLVSTEPSGCWAPMGAQERLLTAHWGVSVPGQPRPLKTLPENGESASVNGAKSQEAP